MSMQFGRWNFEGMPAARSYLEKASQLLASYAPDGGDSYSGPGVDIIYRAFHTTRESRREKQPHAARSGSVITWDGRLDNREELIRQLRGDVAIESTDVAIVAAAYERWGTESFGKLMGDWALAIWNPRDQALILAKDFVGTRHLYYAIEKDQVTWSTILDPLVLLAGRVFTLEEEYIAGWLAFFPATHLTPYVGVQAVPPSTFVRVSGGKQTVRKYWDFDPDKRIRYRTDAEYEEHFRGVFGNRYGGGFAAPLRFWPNSVAGWIHRPSFAWPTRSLPKDARKHPGSTRFPTTTIENPIGTSGRISPKWKRSADERAAT